MQLRSFFKPAVLAALSLPLGCASMPDHDTPIMHENRLETDQEVFARDGCDSVSFADRQDPDKGLDEPGATFYIVKRGGHTFWAKVNDSHQVVGWMRMDDDPAPARLPHP